MPKHYADTTRNPDAMTTDESRGEVAGRPAPGARAAAAGEQANGAGGIRTHETLTGLPVFKTGAFNRSATAPLRGLGPRPPEP